MRTPDPQEGRPSVRRRARWATAWLLAGAAAADGQQPLVLPPLPEPISSAPLTVPTQTVKGNDTPVAQRDDAKPKDDAPKPADSPKDEKADGNGKTDAKRAASTGVAMTLGECLAVALDNQPNLTAAKHSLAATQLGVESLDSVGRIAERLSPDVPIRRKQAAKGVAVAAAEVQKVHNEMVYDVTRLYWTYVYARQQEITATDVIEQLEVFKKVLEEIIKAGVPDPRVKLNNFTLYTLQDSIGEVRVLRVKAATGQKQALAALREAMGVDQSFDFHPKDTELPVMAGTVTREEVVDAALSRRPELAQAAAGVDAFRLEICAQGEIRFRKTVPTLASGSDIHSRQVPNPIRNGEYRPGAIAPEMPPMLVGRTESRVARATELSLRQDAVYEKTVNLVRLEAVNAFINWEGTTDRVKEAKEKYDNAKRMVEQARAAVAVKQDPELVVRSEALAGKAQAEYLEAVFEHLKALATLERVTAGSVRPAFPGR